MRCAKFQQILSIFNFGANLGLTGAKYFIKIIFDIKIEIGIFEISNEPNFNKFWALLILGPILDLTGGKQFIKIILDIKMQIGKLEILDMPNFYKF